MKNTTIIILKEENLTSIGGLSIHAAESVYDAVNYVKSIGYCVSSPFGGTIRVRDKESNDIVGEIKDILYLDSEGCFIN